MVLYAAGFNAWNQLHFEKPGVDEPDDISSFTRVVQEGIVNIRPFPSYTRVSIEDGGWRVAGMVPKVHERLREADETLYASFVEASNGVVVVHDGAQTFHQYPSIHSLLAKDKPSHTFPNFPDITQLVAYETGFAALSSTGRVWTWGDERYTACLGRELTDENPADRPGPVPDLDDLPTGPITKLAAGGYVLAALTAGRDLYCWGHAGRSPFLPGLSDAPEPAVIDERDVADVAVGAAHALVLTADGAVYALGDNANGQLGLPEVSFVRSWTRVGLDSVLAPGEAVTGVMAGPRNSFLIAR